MKKIKYGNRKNEGPHRQLDNLKEGDQICQAVLDTLSDDYLSYITHLVKHSKTPIKKQAPQEQEQPSSDSQPLEPPLTSNFPQPQVVHHQQPKHRHHSETGPKRHEHPIAHPPVISHHPQPIPRKLSFQKQTINRDRHMTKKVKKSKMDGYPVDLSLKNEQKTMSFTRNMQAFNIKEREDEDLMISQTFKGKRRSNNSRCYTNSEQSEISRGRVSIHQHITNKDSQRDSQYPFIFEIDNYISHLQTNPQTNFFFKKNKGKERGPSKGKYRAKDLYKEEYSMEQIHNILKENLKLNKKVKSYQEKIQQLQDEVSTHLIQCKGRDKQYRHKIENLIKVLTQASSKINHQKQQITSMKQLLRTFGQKVKQIQHQQEDSEEDESDIGESIIRYMEPTPEIKTKHKRGLQSTMPRHEDDRKYWCD